AHPAPQHRINQSDNPIHRLGLVPPEYLLQLAQERRPLLLPRGIPRAPDPSSALDTPKIKAQEAKGFTAGQVDHPTFLLIEGPVQDRQCLAESLLDRMQQPVMATMSIH